MMQHNRIEACGFTDKAFEEQERRTCGEAQETSGPLASPWPQTLCQTPSNHHHLLYSFLINFHPQCYFFILIFLSIYPVTNVKMFTKLNFGVHSYDLFASLYDFVLLKYN